MTEKTQPRIKLYHRALAAVGDSMYRRECPFCGQGVFLVGRNQETFELEAEDFCVSCGTLIEWVDIEDLRRELG